MEESQLNIFHGKTDTKKGRQTRSLFHQHQEHHHHHHYNHKNKLSFKRHSSWSFWASQRLQVSEVCRQRRDPELFIEAIQMIAYAAICGEMIKTWILSTNSMTTMTQTHDGAGAGFTPTASIHTCRPPQHHPPAGSLHPSKSVLAFPLCIGTLRNRFSSSPVQETHGVQGEASSGIWVICDDEIVFMTDWWVLLCSVCICFY